MTNLRGNFEHEMECNFLSVFSNELGSSRIPGAVTANGERGIPIPYDPVSASRVLQIYQTSEGGFYE